MKICIVTVYDSINVGSYWQARVLGDYLKEKGHEVVYLKRKTAGGSALSQEKIKRFVRKFFQHGFSSAFRHYNSVNTFRKEQQYFTTISADDPGIHSIDLFILGSDTIWNLHSAFYLSHIDTFFGKLFTDKKTISYAASVANTNEAEIDKYKSRIGDLNHLFAISVRDMHSEAMIRRCTDKPICIVCDPTLLYPKIKYEEYVDTQQRRNGSYCYLYLFEELNKTQKAAIKRYCKERSLSLINGVNTSNASICDENSVLSPAQFITDLYYADYVITDTFHGTIFSVNFNKQFISINREKNKVNEFLGKTGLSERIVYSDGEIDNALHKEIDYLPVNSMIEDMRDYSIYFLANALGS